MSVKTGKKYEIIFMFFMLLVLVAGSSWNLLLKGKEPSCDIRTYEGQIIQSCECWIGKVREGWAAGYGQGSYCRGGFIKSLTVDSKAKLIWEKDIKQGKYDA